MIFIVLVLLAAFFLEGIGTWISVIGLSALFAGSPIVVILAICLDFAKLVTVSFLHKNWHGINLLMKSYLTAAACILVLITSSGAFGFLSGEFQKSISSTNEQRVLIVALTEEQTRLQTRKNEIDKQIANLPEKTVRGRTTLMRQFGPELDRINARLIEIDAQLPQLKIDAIKKNVKVGPITYVAEVFGTSPEAAVKWIILTIILVFDPLAVCLLIAANYLITNRAENKKSTDAAATVSSDSVQPEAITDASSAVPEPDEVQQEPETKLELDLPSTDVSPPQMVEELKPTIPTQPPPKKTKTPTKQKQLPSKTPPPAQEPLAKSLLEDIDPSKGDVEMLQAGSKKVDSKINRLYKSDYVDGHVGQTKK